MVLNSMTCVDHVQDLKKYQRAITPTCMTYSNFTARQINPRNYEIPFIGQSATKIQTEQEEKILADLEAQMNTLYSLSDKNTQIVRLLMQSKSPQLLHQGQIRYLDLIKLTRKEYTQIEDQIQALGKSKTLQNIEEQIDKAKNTRKELRFESDELVGKIATQREERQRVLDRIDDVQMKLEEFMQAQKELAKKHPEKIKYCKHSILRIKTKT